MAQESEARVYGMADQANRHPPATQGMRGEKAAADETGYRHEVMLGDGRHIEVAEESGVAYAEATGRAGRTPSLRTETTNLYQPDATQGPLRSNAVPILIGLAASALIIAVTLRNRRAGEDQTSEELPLAGL